MVIFVSLAQQTNLNSLALCQHETNTLNLKQRLENDSMLLLSRVKQTEIERRNKHPLG